MSDTRGRVQRVVEDTIRAAHGTEALTSGPISSTISIPVTRPTNYLHGVTAARQVAYAAEAIAREHAKKARGEGRSWDEIAQALGFTREATDDPAAEAFLWVAPSPSLPFDRISTSWECHSCGARVLDTGPFGGHPDDDEEGHRAGCARHAAEVAAWRERTGWDDEE